MQLQVYGQPMVGYPLCPTVQVESSSSQVYLHRAHPFPTQVFLLTLLILSDSGAEQVSFSDVRDCQWRWYRSGERTADTSAHDSQRRHLSPQRWSTATPAHEMVSETGGESAGWQLLPGADQRVYIPTAEDAGHRLRVECIPTRYTFRVGFLAFYRGKMLMVSHET